MPDHPNLVANRQAKAHRFASALLAHCPDQATPANVGMLTTDDWQRVADLLGEKLPSFETRALIVRALTTLTEPEDVFAGFPKGLR